MEPKCKTSREFLTTNILLSNLQVVSNLEVDVVTLQYLEDFRQGILDNGNSEQKEKVPKAEKNEGEEDEEFSEISESPSNNDWKKASANSTAKKSNSTEGCRDVNECKIVRLTAKDVRDSSILDAFWDLKSLDISNNEIQDVFKLGSIRYLETINASHNLMETFLEIEPPVPVNLERVDFSYNRVSTIIDLYQYWALTHVNLSHNKLTTVEGFSGLEYLQVLDLSYNEIRIIFELDCPNLLNLNLSNNCLDEIAEFIGCTNLRFLDLEKNRLSSIKGLKYLSELTELNLAENNIEDVIEIEHLKSLMNLSNLKLRHNPISSVQNWRLVFSYTLPQVLWLDDDLIEATDLRTALNLFNPSFQKLACLDHAEILLHQACQFSNNIFDDFCRNRPLPPILLLVGPPRSNSHTLAMMLKQNFSKQVYLGGLHSTATKVDGSDPKFDIPTSDETFLEMRRRGEFITMSRILGRACGFATSQIAKAAEKGALLVASVTLKAALSLRDWNFNPKLILVLPSSSPEFVNEDVRTESIRKSSENNEAAVSILKMLSKGEGSTGAVKSSTTIGAERQGNNESHLIKFAGLLSVVPSRIGKSDDDSSPIITRDINEESSNRGQRSILKPPTFGVDLLAEDDVLLDEFQASSKDGGDPKLNISDVHVNKSVQISTIEHSNRTTDLEMKRKSRRLKSIGPGMESYFDIENDYGSENGEIEAEYENNEEDLPNNLEHPVVLFKSTDNFNTEAEDEDDDLVNTIIETQEGEEKELENENNKNVEKSAKVHKIKEPVNYMESEQAVAPENIKILKISHKDAMTFSIIDTKERYFQFHQDNPGFFHLVVDTSQIIDSYKTISDLATEELLKFSKDSVPASASTNELGVNEGSRNEKLHAEANQVDAKYFLDERMRMLKNSCEMWTSGLDENTESRVRRFQSNGVGSELLFTKPSCKGDLLDPEMSKKSMTLKMKRIAQVHEKRTRCAHMKPCNFKPSDCKL